MNMKGKGKWNDRGKKEMTKKNIGGDRLEDINVLYVRKLSKGQKDGAGKKKNITKEDE